MQYYRGWWYLRVPVAPQEFKIRMALPYDLPDTAHFHVLIMPESNIQTFTGSRSEWPKGWIWNQGPSGTSQLTPLAHPQVIAEKTLGPLRVAPSALLSPTMSWTIPWGTGGTFDWKWSEVESKLAYHDGTHPLNGEDFIRGGRTPWLDLGQLMAGVTMPTSAISVLVAIAPYHEGTAGDETFSCYPAQQNGNHDALRPRQELDYPNDPTLLWGAHHEDAVGTWRTLAQEGTQEVFGLIDRYTAHASQFTQAWLAGTYQFNQWSGNTNAHLVEVPIRRPLGLSLVRTLEMEEGVVGQTRSSAILPASILAGYFVNFKVGQAVNLAPITPPIQATEGAGPPVRVTYNVAELPALDTQEVQTWMTWQRMNLGTTQSLLNWVTFINQEYPGFSIRVNRWLVRLGHTFAVVGEGLDRLGCEAIWTFIWSEELYSRQPGVPPGFEFDWEDSPGSGVLDWDTVLGFTVINNDSLYQITGGFGGVFNQMIDSAEQLYRNNMPEGMSDENTVVTSATDVRRPMAWATMLPPIFNQLGALASPELVGASFAWWRRSAEILTNPALLSAVGINSADVPWESWFPVENAWWTQYASLPWARPWAEVVYPPFVNQQGWRFKGTSLEWPERVKDMRYWPPQPPATRASNNGDEFPAMVLPTAAYPMGPIEIKMKP